MTALPTVKHETLCYRIWAFAKPRGWDVTLGDIADAIDEPIQKVNGALRSRGWLPRIRAPQPRGRNWRENGARIIEDRYVVRDVLAGRVNSEFTA